MNTPFVSTDTEQMETTGRNFETTAEDLNNSLSSLGNRVAGMQAAWLGKGGTSFQTVMTNWSKATASMYEALRDTAVLIRTGGQKYGTTDHEAANKLESASTIPTLPL